MIGEILGNRYEIVEKIGEGGMSIVYKARCNKLDRFVAVKILKKELCDNDEIVNKFKKEATAIATLSDNNIVNVLDVGSQDEINYIVMEYVKGKTLKEVIKEFGKLNYETSIRIATQIAKALECAHKNKIIHRDVKPHNVLVTEDGLIKVTDFGIAKSASSETLTNTATIMGSAQYFSPEQAKGSIVDTRTDIYSLGVVMYEMVTGKIPFEADSPVSIALKHIQEEPIPPKQVNSRIPDSFNKLILKAMEKDPNKRYQTAREMINDLIKIKEDPNAIIDKKDEEVDDGHTLVMTAINPAINNLPNNKEVEEYYDDYQDEDYEEEYDDEDKKKKNGINKKLITIIAAAVGFLLVIGLGSFIAFGGLSSSNKDVTVPSIKGMSLSEAKKALEKAGLILEEGGTDKSDKPEGTILDVYPIEGSTVNSGSKVRVIISGGETKLKMPDLRENTLDDAKKYLDKHGLKNYTVSEKYSDSVPKGEVISTDPEANAEITKDTKITIYVSTGPDKKYVNVPRLKGLSKNEVINVLSANNLKYSFSNGDDGVVTSVSPAEGEKVLEGTTITVTMSDSKIDES